MPTLAPAAAVGLAHGRARVIAPAASGCAALVGVASGVGQVCARVIALARAPVLALVGAVAVCACVAPVGAMDARYEASLLRWQGTTRAQLEAAWGRPTRAEATPDGEVLTWIVRTDIDARAASGAPPIVAVTRVGGTGATVATATPALSAPPVPITCTTHFVLKDGRVAGWKFEGLGCGAPS